MTAACGWAAIGRGAALALPPREAAALFRRHTLAVAVPSACERRRCGGELNRDVWLHRASHGRVMCPAQKQAAKQHNLLANTVTRTKYALRVQRTAFKSSARPPSRPPRFFRGPRTSRLRLPVSGAALIEDRPRPRRNDLSQRWNAGSRRPDHVLAPGQRSRRERAHSTFSLSRAAE